MAVEVERFDVNEKPDSGRPRIVEFRGREGTLAVHVSRGDGSLWLFALGPRGGDRGTVAVSVPRAVALLAWLDGETTGFYAGGTWIRWRETGDGEPFELIVAKSVMGRHWRMRFDAPARDELLACLRGWAQGG
jgi:hypothetical protein